MYLHNYLTSLCKCVAEQGLGEIPKSRNFFRTGRCTNEWNLCRAMIANVLDVPRRILSNPRPLLCVKKKCPASVITIMMASIIHRPHLSFFQWRRRHRRMEIPETERLLPCQMFRVHVALPSFRTKARCDTRSFLYFGCSYTCILL